MDQAVILSTRAATELAPFQEKLRRLGFDYVLVHGSGPAADGATVFALLRCTALGLLAQ